MNVEQSWYFAVGSVKMERPLGASQTVKHRNSIRQQLHYKIYTEGKWKFISTNTLKLVIKCLQKLYWWWPKSGNNINQFMAGKYTVVYICGILTMEYYAAITRIKLLIHSARVKHKNISLSERIRGKCHMLYYSFM